MWSWSKIGYPPLISFCRLVSSAGRMRWEIPEEILSLDISLSELLNFYGFCPGHLSQVRIRSKRMINVGRSAFPPNPRSLRVDTICNLLETDTIKMKAIKELRKTHYRPNRVLVIDADLTSNPLEPQHDASDRRDVMHASITASSWQQRLWTLQGAVLAKEL